MKKEEAGKMRNGPEEEKDAAGTEEGRHEIDHKRHLRGCGGKVGKQVGCKHKEWRTGGMANLQPVAGSYEFGTIPQAGCGFY